MKMIMMILNVIQSIPNSNCFDIKKQCMINKIIIIINNQHNNLILRKLFEIITLIFGLLS